MLPFNMFLPLAFEETQTTMNAVYKAVSGASVGGASGTAALTLATFFVGLKLIRMSYNVFSDEQQSGFGGIRLIEVLRPILIVLAIAASPTVFSYMNAVVNYISGSIGEGFNAGGTTASIEAVYRNAAEKTIASWDLSKEMKEKLAHLDANERMIIDEAVAENLKGYEENTKTAFGGSFASGLLSQNNNNKKQAYTNAIEEGKKFRQNTLEEVRDYLAVKDPVYQSVIKSNQEWYEKRLEEINNNSKFSISGAEKQTFAQKEELEILYRQKEEYDDIAKREAIKRAGGEGEFLTKVAQYSALMKGADGASTAATVNDALDSQYEFKNVWKKVADGTYLRHVAFWLYDVMYFCIINFAQIGLILMSMFFPWILCLSLLDYFKQAIWQYAATYLTLSMYKVVASGIRWIIGTSVGSIHAINISMVMPNMVDSLAKIDSVKAALGIQTIFYIAGFVALTKVGSLVHMLIPGGASTGDFAGGGVAMATGAISKGKAAAGTVGGGALKVATGGTQVQSAIKGKKAAESTSAFQQNVTNALGKLTGTEAGGE